MTAWAKREFWEAAKALAAHSELNRAARAWAIEHATLVDDFQTAWRAMERVEAEANEMEETES